MTGNTDGVAMGGSLRGGGVPVFVGQYIAVVHLGTDIRHHSDMITKYI
jgi:hypothetical protein